MFEGYEKEVIERWENQAAEENMKYEKTKRVDQIRREQEDKTRTALEEDFKKQLQSMNKKNEEEKRDISEEFHAFKQKTIKTFVDLMAK